MSDKTGTRFIEFCDAVTEIRERIEEIVCADGEDAGVIMLSNDAPVTWDAARQCYCYTLEHFSPLGDALIDLHRRVSTLERKMNE